MARPVGADAERTRARIREAALTLFAERGLDGAAVRAIARAADVSLAMVHHYFGNKDGLYAACVDSMYEDITKQAERLGETLAEEEPSAALLEQAVREASRFARANQLAVRLLLRSVMDTGGLSAERRDRALIPFLDRASHSLAPLVGRDAASLRLPLQSVVFLVGRYAISADDELLAMTGTTASGQAAAEAVEDHLVAASRALLGL